MSHPTSLIPLSPRVSLCPDDIVQIMGESNYSRIILRDGQRIVVSQTRRKLMPQIVYIYKSYPANSCIKSASRPPVFL